MPNEMNKKRRKMNYIFCKINSALPQSVERIIPESIGNTQQDRNLNLYAHLLRADIHSKSCPPRVHNLGKTATDFGINLGINLGLNFGLNDAQLAVLKLLAVHPTTTLQAVADELNTTRRNVEAHVNALKKKGVLKRIGSKKTGHWKLHKP
jgi:biotin operon repressor